MTVTWFGTKDVWLVARDCLVGIGLFLVLTFGLCGGLPGRSMHAAASDAAILAAQALAAPPDAAAEHALLTALARIPSGGGQINAIDFFALGTAFAFLFALNVALLRHLRRAYAIPRPSGRRRHG